MNLYILSTEVCNYLCLPWFFPLKILKTVFLCGSSNRLLTCLPAQTSTGGRANAVHLGKPVKPTSERLQIFHNTWLTQTVTILGNLNLEFMKSPYPLPTQALLQNLGTSTFASKTDQGQVTHREAGTN